jgi:hypothetical protein
MNNIDIIVSYLDTVEQAKSFLFRLPYVEYHPDLLTYEEVQEMDARLLRLNDDKVYNLIASKAIDISIINRVFRPLLTDPHITSNWREITDSLYFDEKAIRKRLSDEGREEHYILFYVRQCFMLQGTIMERTECIRKMLSEWGSVEDEEHIDGLLNEFIPEDIIEYIWEVPNKEIQRYSPVKPIAVKKILRIICDGKYGIFPNDLTEDYLSWSIRHSQFGKLLSYASKINRTADFKLAIDLIIKKYFPKNEEYRNMALLSMGIKTADKYHLSRQHPTTKGDYFLKELKRVL